MTPTPYLTILHIEFYSQMIKSVTRVICESLSINLLFSIPPWKIEIFERLDKDSLRNDNVRFLKSSYIL